MANATRRPVVSAVLAAALVLALVLFALPAPSRTVLRQMAYSILPGLLYLAEQVRRLAQDFL